MVLAIECLLQVMRNAQEKKNGDVLVWDQVIKFYFVPEDAFLKSKIRN